MSSLDMKKGNVANQREHLILLLANIDIRNKNPQVPHQVNHFADLQYYVLLGLWCDLNLLWISISASHFNITCLMQLKIGTVQQLSEKIFKNYISWCNYLRCKPHLGYVLLPYITSTLIYVKLNFIHSVICVLYCYYINTYTIYEWLYLFILEFFRHHMDVFI